MFCLRKIFPTFFVISTFIANSNNFALAEIGYTFADGAFLKGKFINGTDDNNKNSHNEQKKQTNNGEHNNQDSPTKNGGYDKNKTGSIRNKIRLKINGIGEFQYF